MKPPAPPTATRSTSLIGLIRVTLSNGYRAYHRRTDGDKPARPQKRVRFVKGHTIIPDTLPNITRRQLQLEPGPDDSEVQGDYCEEDDDAELTGGEQMQEDMAGLGKDMRGSEEMGAGVVDDINEKKTKGGRFVDRGGFRVRRKQPRFRGSGMVQVLDDPVRDGLILARSGVRLPSDRWRDRPDAGCQVRKGRGGMGRGKGLRYEDGERGVGFGMADVVRGEMGYTLKVVNSRRAKRGEGSGVFDSRVVQTERAVAESVVLTEAGSESERDDDYDFLADFPLEEADGWVPVMVAEEDEGDNWMSLTGSWVMMGGMTDANK